MDAVIDARFERVEKALGPLIDSISKYNPSISRVSDLVLADRELQDGLRNVQRHQNNVLRIHKLKATTAGLDAQIRSTLEVLASTRKDMTATPSTVFPDRMPNPISFEELLGFARRISKTTLPPPGVTNGVDLDGTGGETTPGGGPAILTTGQDAGASTPAGPLPQTPTGLVSVAATPTPMSAVVNGGVGTPAPGTPSNVRHDAAMLDVPQQAPLGGGGGGGGGANSGEAGGGNDKSVLPELFSQWMNPHTGAIFLPWPHEDQIRMGGLAANQSLADRGIDPKGYDPAEEERLAAESAAEAKRLEEERAEAERKAMAEREARARQEMERRRAQQREMEQRDAQLRGSAGSGARSPTATSPTIKKQFQFTAFDDDDSDNSD